MSWTEERVEILRRLWGTGKSASEIAEIIGDVTRNAVIGKAHRLGLSGQPSPIRKKPERPVAAPRLRAPVEERAEGSATIHSLTERMCRWPIGDPKHDGFRFCGKSAAEDGPYCAEHASLAYQPPTKRRDEDRRAVG